MRFHAVLSATYLVALLAFTGCGGKTSNTTHGTRELPLQSRDGVELHATLFPCAASTPPGLILVHGAGQDRRAWEPFARRAQQEGYLCLAFDLRGHGESLRKGADTLSYRRFTTEDWRAVGEDIRAAQQAIVEAGADPDNLALVGASIGANLALQYAVDHPGIQALVLLSPGLDYRGIKTESAIAAYGMRPALLMTSEGDSYSAATCATLKARAAGFCEVRTYPGSAHGTDILAASPNALEQVFTWLKPILRSSKMPAPRQ